MTVKLTDNLWVMSGKYSKYIIDYCATLPVHETLHVDQNSKRQSEKMIMKRLGNRKQENTNMLLSLLT